MATAIWLGHGLAIAQVQRATISGTWANTDTATVTINGKDVVHTLTTEGNTYSDILTNLATTLNASIIPEFAEVTWANSANTDIQGTADTAGKPFVATNSEVTGGSGALGDFAITTGNAGPYCANTADNWSTGATPTNSDAVVFEYSDVPCRYELDALSGIQPTSLTIKQTYTGTIGLPRTNEDASTSYVEYRERYLKLAPTTLSIGQGEGTGSGRIMIDPEAQDCVATLYGKGSRQETGIPCVLLKGTNTSNSLTVIRGDVGVAFFAGETANLAGGLDVGYATSVLGDADVVCGSGVTHGSPNQSGGKLEISSNATTVTQYDGELTVKAAATITTLTAGGVVYDYSTGTFTTVTVTGEYNHSRSMAGKTITNASIYRSGTYKDPYGVVILTNGLDFVQCSPDETTWNVVPNRTWTPTGI